LYWCYGWRDALHNTNIAGVNVCNNNITPKKRNHTPLDISLAEFLLVYSIPMPTMGLSAALQSVQAAQHNST